MTHTPPPAKPLDPPPDPATPPSRAVIGAEIRRARKVAGLSAQVASKLLGQTDVKKVYRWETGERIPSFPIALQMAKIYRCHPDQLSPALSAFYDGQIAKRTEDIERWRKKDPAFRNTPNGRRANWLIEQQQPAREGE